MALKPASKAGAKSAPAKVVTVTLRDLGTALAEMHEMPKKQALEMLTQSVEMITKHLKKGSRIRLAGLGILQVRKRPARMGRNPATGEQIKIAAKTVVKARIAKQLKDTVLPKK